MPEILIPCLGPAVNPAGCPRGALVTRRPGSNQGARCADCRGAVHRGKRDRRGDASAAYRAYIAAQTQAWLATYGYTCAGCFYSNNQPHPCQPVYNPLTMVPLHSLDDGGNRFGPVIGRCQRGTAQRGTAAQAARRQPLTIPG